MLDVLQVRIFKLRRIFQTEAKHPVHSDVRNSDQNKRCEAVHVEELASHKQ
jgi:hypothetical protein